MTPSETPRSRAEHWLSHAAEPPSYVDRLVRDLLQENQELEERAERYALEGVSLTERLMAAEAQIATLTAKVEQLKRHAAVDDIAFKTANRERVYAEAERDRLRQQLEAYGDALPPAGVAPDASGAESTAVPSTPPISREDFVSPRPALSRADKERAYQLVIRAGMIAGALRLTPADAETYPEAIEARRLLGLD